jgi:hypothetical protein
VEARDNALGGRNTPVEVAAVASPRQSQGRRSAALGPRRLRKSLELEAGLLSMEGWEDMKRFLGAMGTVATLVSVPQLSAALG